MLLPPIPLHNPAVIVAPPRATTPAASAAVTPVPLSEALLAHTLAEAERLAELAPEKGQVRTRLLAAAGAYVAVDRPADAGRLYHAAVASAERDKGGGTSGMFLGTSPAGWWQHATAVKAAKIAAQRGDSGIVHQVTFLVARHVAPAGSPLRDPNEKEAYQTWR